MGNTLSEPETAKSTSYCQNSKFCVGSSSMQGWRVKMEDSHTHILSLPDDPETAFFAVYDGHGGSKIAEYAGKHLHKIITKRKEYHDGDIKEALKKGFLEFDQIILEDETLKNEQAGSTAIAILIKNGTVYCANVGDSRAIASIAGRVEELSFDHKPSNYAEFARIKAAGGYVQHNRVNGSLALSRALGDFPFKKNQEMTPEEQIVTADPDIEIRQITDEWEFIILACDGIWDVMDNSEVVDFVREQIGMFVEPEEICEKLMMKCLAPDCQMAGLGCDNMTVVIIALLHDKLTYGQLSLKCANNLPAKNKCESASDHEDVETRKVYKEWLDSETENRYVELAEEQIKVTDINNDLDSGWNELGSMIRNLDSVKSEDIIQEANVENPEKSITDQEEHTPEQHEEAHTSEQDEQTQEESNDISQAANPRPEDDNTSDENNTDLDHKVGHETVDA